MPQFSIPSFATILKGLKDRVVARTTLTDLTSTSDVLLVLAAVSRALEKAYVQMVRLLKVLDIDEAKGPDLDEWGKRMNPVKISRGDSVIATTTVIFSRPGVVGAISIPIGTQVKTLSSETGSEYTFSTTALGSIADGFSTSAPVAVSADDEGSAYNVGAGAIKAFVSKPSGVTAVTNPNPVTNGSDEESDDNYRNRMKSYMRSLARCPVSGIEGALYRLYDSVSGKTVQYVKVVVDDFSPARFVAYVDDGNGTAETTAARVNYAVISPFPAAFGGEVDIYLADKPIKEGMAFQLRINAIVVSTANYSVNYATGHVKLTASAYPTGLTAGDVVDASYTYYTGLIKLAQKVVDGDPTNRATYPGYIGAGNMGQVKAPYIQNQTITANVTVKSGFNQATVLAAVKTAIIYYINHLDMGEDVIYAELIEQIMAVTGVYDVQLTAPTSNRYIADYQLARTSSGLVTVN